jgi:hypothetical protein
MMMRTDITGHKQLLQLMDTKLIERAFLCDTKVTKGKKAKRQKIQNDDSFRQISRSYEKAGEESF